MNHDVDVVTMVRRANPLPDLERFDPDEAAAGVAAIEAAWQAERQTPAAIPLTSPSRHRTLRYALAFVAAGVIALVLIGGPLFLRDRQEAPIIDEPTTTMPTTVTTAPVVTTTEAVTTTTTTIVLLPPMPGMTFAQSAESDLGAAWVGGVAEANAGLVVVGTDVPCGVTDGEFTCNANGITWIVGDDGLWQRTGDPALFSGPEDTALDGSNQWIHDVTAGPLGVVAVGEDAYDAAVWVSADGFGWSRVPASDDLGGGSILFGVAHGGPGLVGVGVHGLNAGVWVSEDATSWLLIENAAFEGDSEPVRMATVAAGPGSSVVAAGSLGFLEDYDQPSSERPAIWVSPDGLEWERLPDDTLEAIGVEEIGSVHGGDAGFLMIGSPVEGGGEGMWMSPDGRTWERIDVPYMGSSDEIGSVDHIGTRWDGTRWVSVGLDYTAGTVWASFEPGVAWQSVGSIGSEEFAAGFEITHVLVSESGLTLVAEAEAQDEDLTRSIIWTGTWDE